MLGALAAHADVAVASTGEEATEVGANFFGIERGQGVLRELRDDGVVGGES